MNPRDQADAGGDDSTTTVQRDDTYRSQILSGSGRQAEMSIDAALAEFQIAAGSGLDRTKTGEDLPK